MNEPTHTLLVACKEYRGQLHKKTAEIERLTKARLECERQYQEQVALVAVEMDKRMRAEAAVERLRKIIDEIKDGFHKSGHADAFASTLKAIDEELAAPAPAKEEPKKKVLIEIAEGENKAVAIEKLEATLSVLKGAAKEDPSTKEVWLWDAEIGGYKKVQQVGAPAKEEPSLEKAQEVMTDMLLKIGRPAKKEPTHRREYTPFHFPTDERINGPLGINIAKFFRKILGSADPESEWFVEFTSKRTAGHAEPLQGFRVWQYGVPK